MLLRLVRPVRRPGSSMPQFVQRIPRDVRSRAVGRTLEIPIGGETARVVVTPSMGAIRVSLRSRDPSQAKVRQAEIAAYLEGIWRALRNTVPVTLTRRQATALAGRLYRAWASGEGRERVTAMMWTRTPTGWEGSPDVESAEVEAAGFRSAQDRLKTQLEENAADLEPTLGPLVDRLLIAEGIAEVDPACRQMTLEAFGSALVDAFARRQREAEGDYRPDPKAERFPEWQPPQSPAQATHAPSKGRPSLKGLVEDWS